MPATALIPRELPDAAATDRLGARLAGALGPGDCVLVSGPLGAGKSALCRALIRAKLGRPEAEVPSPSYTLVNVYDAGGAEIWHADLYRLSGPDEIGELGLWDALVHALVLVEWPERLGPERPARRLELALTPVPGAAEARHLSATAQGGGWDAALAQVSERP